MAMWICCNETQYELCLLLDLISVQEEPAVGRSNNNSDRQNTSIKYIHRQTGIFLDCLLENIMSCDVPCDLLSLRVILIPLITEYECCTIFCCLSNWQVKNLHIFNHCEVRFDLTRTLASYDNLKYFVQFNTFTDLV